MRRRGTVCSCRSHHALKRGGDKPRLPLEEAAILSYERDAELIALDDALVSLEAIDPRQSRVVELRFFGGLTVEEIAQFLEVSSVTVKRDLRAAKAWLRREIAKK